MDCTRYVAKTKALISFAVTAKLICVFVFAYAKSGFSHDAAQIILCLLEVNATIKFLKFRTPTNFTVKTLKFKLKGSTMVLDLQMELQTVQTQIRLLLGLQTGKTVIRLL